MKINPINFNLNRKLASNNQNKETQNKMASQPERDFVYGYYPAFSGRSGKASSLIRLNFLKYADKIHCPYCGLNLIKPEVFEKLDLSDITQVSADVAITNLKRMKNKLSKEDLKKLSLIENANEKTPGETLDRLLKTSGSKASPIFTEVGYRKLDTREYTKKLIDTMQDFEESLQPAQKEVFKTLRALNKDYPQKSIEELMSSMRPVSLPRLQNVQLAVLQDIAKESSSLSRNSAQNLTQIIKNYKDIILDKGPKPFKRKDLFREIEDLKSVAHNDGEILTPIKEIAGLLSKYSAGLKKNQSSMIDELGKLSDGLSEISAQSFSQILKKYRATISNKTFEPDKLIEDIDGLINRANEEEMAFGMIRKTATAMPSAVKDFDAFVVKYSKRTRMKNNKLITDNERSAKEITQSILGESKMGVDHYVSKDAGGSDRRSNTIPACSPCNNEKKNQPPSNLIIQNPEKAAKNYNTFLNDIANMVNKKEKNEDYLINISNSIKSEAGGLLDIEISKVNDLYIVKVINKLVKEPVEA